MTNKPKRKRDLSSLFGFAVFLLVVAGQPLARFINQLLRNGTIALPTINIPWNSLLPLAIAIGGVIIGAVVINRVFGQISHKSQSPGTLPSLPQQPLVDTQTPSKPPQFEPIISPILLLVGMLGVVTLLGLGAFVLLQATP